MTTVSGVNFLRTLCGSPLLDSGPAPQSGGLLPYLALVKLKPRGSATVLCPNVQLPPISTQVRKTCILQGEEWAQRLWETAAKLG